MIEEDLIAQAPPYRVVGPIAQRGPVPTEADGGKQHAGAPERPPCRGTARRGPKLPETSEGVDVHPVVGMDGGPAKLIVDEKAPPVKWRLAAERQGSEHPNRVVGNFKRIFRVVIFTEFSTDTGFNRLNQVPLNQYIIDTEQIESRYIPSSIVCPNNIVCKEGVIEQFSWFRLLSQNAVHLVHAVLSGLYNGQREIRRCC